MNEAAPLTGAGAAASAEWRRWWLLERNAVPIDTFRIVAGVGLMMHFARRAWEAPSVFAWCEPSDVRLLASGAAVAPVEWLGTRLTSDSLRSAFGVAAFLCSGIVLGVAPRWSAALAWAWSLIVYRAIFPIAGLDDYLANLLTLLLWLMPIGTTLSLSKRPGRAGLMKGKAKVSGLATTVVLGGVSVLYLSLGGELGVFPIGAATSTGYSELAVRMLPLAFVLPLPGLSLLGIALQLGLHGYCLVTTAAPLWHWTLAATGLLFWGDVEAPGRRTRVIDAGGVAAVTCGIVLSCVLGGGSFHASPAAATRFASDVGLLPPAPDRVSASQPTLSVVASETTTDGARTLPFPGRGRLARRFVAALGEAPVNGRRLAILRSLASGYCARSGYFRQRGAFVLTTGEANRVLADFECGIGGTLTEVH